MKRILAVASTILALGAIGCETHEHHHAEHWDREHDDYYRHAGGPPEHVYGEYPPPPPVVYREYPEYRR